MIALLEKKLSSYNSYQPIEICEIIEQNIKDINDEIIEDQLDSLNGIIDGILAARRMNDLAIHTGIGQYMNDCHREISDAHSTYREFRREIFAILGLTSN
ncbi:MAG: hypothetical protein KBB11_11880 [Bacteroidales bacterium]|nr:hypothetical protein [Bacteroidales bacterium]